VPKAKHIPF